MLRQSAAHFLLSSVAHLSHSAAHFSHTLAHSAQTLLTSLLSDVIAFFAFSQAAIQSLLILEHEDLASFPQDFSQVLHEAMHASHAAMQALYLSLSTVLLTALSLDVDDNFAAIVTNPITANTKIIFFMRLLFNY